MTNWEWITSDKDRLVEVLNTDGDFWENAFTNLALISTHANIRSECI